MSGERELTILLDRRPTNMRIRDTGQAPYYPDVIMCIARSSGVILSMEIARPTDGHAPIVETARKALESVRHESAQVNVVFATRQDHVAAVLASAFAEEVKVQAGADFDPWDTAYIELDLRMGSGTGMLPYLWRGDITDAEVAAFFDAAADLYKARPWRWFSDANGLQMADPIAQGRTMVVAVMGSEGIARGIAIFDSARDYEAMVLHDRRPDVTYVALQRLKEVPHTVTAQAEEHRWTVVNKSAFPTMMRYRAGEVIPVSSDEVRRAAVALRAATAAAAAVRNVAGNAELHNPGSGT